MVNRKQKYWEEVQVGDSLSPVEFPLTVYRLIMEAGSNRDFNSIHSNTEYAQLTGAPEMYANNYFLQGMWERTVREYIGLAGKMKKLRGFRMKHFNMPGDTVITKGKVKSKWIDGNEGFVELEMWSENSQGISIGPGTVVVSLPSKP